MTTDTRQRRDYIRQIRNITGFSVTTVACEGLTLRLDLRDEGVAQMIYRERAYEPMETAFIRSQLRPGQVFIDVGANIGYYSLIASRCVGSLGTVVAVEPEEYNFHLLRHNVKANGAESIVRLCNVALGVEPAIAEIYRSNTNYGDHRLYIRGEARSSQAVPVERLDQLVDRLGLKAVDFIKIDVQGFEEHVCKGMTGIFENNRRPTVLMEFWPTGIRNAGGSPADLLSLFSTRDYQAYAFSERGLDQSHYDSIWDLVPNGITDAAYVNLVFMPN